VINCCHKEHPIIFTRSIPARDNPHQDVGNPYYQQFIAFQTCWQGFVGYFLDAIVGKFIFGKALVGSRFALSVCGRWGLIVAK
jgi:hypothetical protein